MKTWRTWIIGLALMLAGGVAYGQGLGGGGSSGSSGGSKSKDNQTIARLRDANATLAQRVDNLEEELKTLREQTPEGQGKLVLREVQRLADENFYLRGLLEKAGINPTAMQPSLDEPVNPDKRMQQMHAKGANREVATNAARGELSTIEEQRETIASLTKQLTELTAEKTHVEGQRDTALTKLERIATAQREKEESEISAARASSARERSEDLGELAMGKTGKIISKVRVFQILDGSNMLIEYGDKMAWVEGVITLGIVDNQSIRLPQRFEVVGTRQYKTAIGGSQTVFVLRAK